MVLGVVMAGLAAYQLAHVLMLVFASVLVAVLLTALADGVERVTRLPRAAAMAVAVLALLAGMVGFGVLFAQQLYRQLADVVDLLPGAVSNLGDRLGFEWDLSATPCAALWSARPVAPRSAMPWATAPPSSAC